MTDYQTLPSGPPVPPRDRIACRDRWPDDDLSKLRELLWLRLQTRAAIDSAVADRALTEVEGMSRQLRRDGERLQRQREGRQWGRWLIETSRALHRWVRLMERERERA